MRNGSRYTRVPRRLVVEREAPDRSAVVTRPRRARRRASSIRIGRAGGIDGERRLDVDRVERVAEEHVLDVHQQQLLVLLLVVQAELDERGEVGPRVGVAAVDQLVHRGVDVGAVARDLVDGRAREQAALRCGDDGDRRPRSTS